MPKKSSYGAGIGAIDDRPGIRIKDDGNFTGIRGSLPPTRLLAGSERVQEALGELERARDGARDAARELAALREGIRDADRADLAAQADAFRAGKTADAGTKNRDALDRQIAAAERKYRGWQTFRDQAITDLQNAFDESAESLLADAEAAFAPLQARWDAAVETLSEIAPDMQEWRALQRWIVRGGGKFRTEEPAIELRGDKLRFAEVLEALLMVGLSDAERERHARRLGAMPGAFDDAASIIGADDDPPVFIESAGPATK